MIFNRIVGILNVQTWRDIAFEMSLAAIESASISCKNVSHDWNSVDGQVGLRQEKDEKKKIENYC